MEDQNKFDSQMAASSGLPVEVRAPFVKPVEGPLESMFQQLAFFAFTLGAGFLASEAFNKLFRSFIDVSDWGRWKALLVFGPFILAAAAINIPVSSVEGGRRKGWAVDVSERYAFPIVLALGLYVGWHYRGYTDRHSWEGEALYAAQAACADTPRCLALAQVYNGGNQVEHYLPSPGR